MVLPAPNKRQRSVSEYSKRVERKERDNLKQLREK
jgi:hypothetical protein